ncbi:DUF4097 family beta strand repeat-containing protein [Evansella sp. AB-P1]|uniref:DUF4097 family beta strand repeat-containing protein n=1 Tax=Evansella sp. AB-P1 TaxID=3037653 RepID=UPI00241CB8B8|nr:DUF4097 family beta strand repeat-containing protein [Evansella sp. AB-P1]MDG5787969.1 DUF4097 family beta strand repeat-containing protein [Evansella sp. AB-P1]
MERFKIGRLSAGGFFIFIGVMWIASNWVEVSIYQLFSYVWPLLLISLGLEIIIRYRKKEEDEKLAYDGVAIGFILAILVISGGFFSFQNSGFAGSLPFFSGAFDTSIDINEQYEVDDLEQIRLEFINGTVQVVGGSAEEISITGVAKSNFHSEEDLQKAYGNAMNVEEGNGSFYYKVKESPPSFFSQNNRFSLDLVITVPKTVFIELDAVNGSLTVEDLEENVLVKTTNGRINIQNIIGNTIVESTNGALTIENIQGNVEARTTNGKIDIFDVTGEILARGTNGAIDISSVTVAGDWSATTTNGRIRLEVPNDADASVVGETTLGSVTGNVNFSRKHEGTSRENREGSFVLNNGTYRIEAKGTNGSLQINTR